MNDYVIRSEYRENIRRHLGVGVRVTVCDCPRGRPVMEGDGVESGEPFLLRAAILAYTGPF